MYKNRNLIFNFIFFIAAIQSMNLCNAAAAHNIISSIQTEKKQVWTLSVESLGKAYCAALEMSTGWVEKKYINGCPVYCYRTQMLYSPADCLALIHDLKTETAKFGQCDLSEVRNMWLRPSAARFVKSCGKSL